MTLLSLYYVAISYREYFYFTDVIIKSQIFSTFATKKAE